MDDLYATFLPRFAAKAKVRIARSIELANRRERDDGSAIASELHSIAGEAGLLGLRTIVSLARTGEETARRYHTHTSERDAEALIASLDELRRAIELVAPAKPPG